MKTRIKTYIKFYKGLGDASDRLYGFVTKTNRSWRGCRQEEEKKKIVLLDPSLSNLEPNTLYKCSLVPMHNDQGFIAKTASRIKFKATISTTTKKNSYQVKVSFGNKRIIYNPASKSERENNIQAIAEMLRKRMDLQDSCQVAEDFINCACAIQRLYKQFQATQV